MQHEYQPFSISNTDFIVSCLKSATSAASCFPASDTPNPLRVSPIPCYASTNRWAPQHGMMARLLQLKKAIVDYFKRHDSHNRKLSTREWVITNEVCSLLDVVAEVTIRIQGSEDTHISETMFNMLEIKEIFEEDTHKIRTPDQAYNDGDVLKEPTSMDDLSSETLMVHDVMIAMLDKKKLDQATMPLERICALLDPRRKECLADHLVNGNSNLKSSAIDDVNSIARTFVEETFGSTSSAAQVWWRWSWYNHQWWRRRRQRS